MSALTFDTLKFSDTLKAAGVPSAQAEAEARAFATAIGDVEVVTRKDLQIELAPIRAELTLLKWMVGLSLALSTGILAILARLAFSLPH